MHSPSPLPNPRDRMASRRLFPFLPPLDLTRECMLEQDWPALALSRPPSSRMRMTRTTLSGPRSPTPSLLLLTNCHTKNRLEQCQTLTDPGTR